MTSWDKSTITYEASALSRQVSSTHSAWPYPVQTLYGNNDITIDGFAPGSLYKITSIDGDLRQSISYTDKRNRGIATVQAGPGV